MTNDPTARQRSSAPARAADQLQPHHPQLLAFCYLTRYVTWEIVQRSFPGVIKSKTAAKDQLKKLRDLGYLKAAPRESVTDPYVYSVMPKAIRLLNQHREPDRALPIVRDETVQPWLLKHELGLSELQTDIRLAARQNSQLRLLSVERRYHQKGKQLRFPLGTGQAGDLRPDLGFLACFDPTGRRHLLHHFAEYDRGTEDPEVFLAKLKLYDTWYWAVGRDYLVDLYQRHGSADPKPNYRRLVVTQHRPGKDQNDHDRLVKLIAKTLELPEASRFNIMLTTDELLNNARTSPNPLAAAVWYPMRFTRSWEAEFNELCETLSRRGVSNNNQTKLLYQWTRSKVETLTRYTLFPNSPVSSKSD